MTIAQIVEQMTLEEKASLCSGLDSWHTKPVERLGVPSMMMSDGPSGLRKQDPHADRPGANESIRAVCFPAACAVAASFDRDVARQTGQAIGDEARREGVAMVLGPAVNIKRSPLCGRNFEYFSEDPYLTAEMALGVIQGIQSRGVGACVKHFACNNQERRRMSVNAEVDERALHEIYFPAFETAVRQGGVWAVMCSYNRVNGVYASENYALLTGVLRHAWGFTGCVVSDWGAVNDRVQALAAGLDLEMPSSNGLNDRRIVEAVRSGQLEEQTLNRAVERVLTVNERCRAHKAPENPWTWETHHTLARGLAAECMVLLKNEGGLLPLRQGESLAVIGLFAKAPRFQGGGSSHVNSFTTTSLMDALEGVPNVRYAQGYRTNSEAADEALIARAVCEAKAAKVAVIVAGLPDRLECEGYDREHMRLPACQIALIKRVAQANPQTVVVLLNGSPVEMPWLPQARAVVEAYLGGQAVGAAMRDVLFGTVNPSGRLPESFPLKQEHSSASLSFGGEGDDAPYRESVFVGYRYYDRKQTDVLFPFGFGLSYTGFAYENLRFSARRVRDTQTLTVSVEVRNTGAVAGKEVVQLYVGARRSAVFRPVRELKGFAKVLLQPGETQTVTFTLDKRAFAYWNVKTHDWHVETGTYAVEIGRNARDMALSGEIEVEGTGKAPKTFTVNSTFEELMENDKARTLLKPLMEQMRRSLASGDENARSETACAAITDEMIAAMVRDSPLRSVLSFGEGRLTYERLEEMVRQINEAP